MQFEALVVGFQSARRRPGHRPKGGVQMPVESFSMLIDGQWRESADGAAFRCTSPVNGEDWAEVPTATTGDVDDAVAAARRAFEDGAWAASSPLMRAGLLRRL